MAVLESIDNLPYSLEAEQSLLGAVLIDPGVISLLLDSIGAESFYRQAHREIFSIMTRLFASGAPIDLITVLEEVKIENVFETDEQAKRYLSDLLNVVPAVSNVEAYARIVREKHYLRMLMETASNIIKNVTDGGEASSLLDDAEQRIYEIRQGRDARGLRRIDEVIVQNLDRLQRLASGGGEDLLGIPTGFVEIDRALTGINKSDLVLIAGRPGMGKTSFALNIAENIAIKNKKSVAVFSLEMSNEQLVTRMLSSQASISSKSLRTGELRGPEEWSRLAAAADRLSKAEIWLDDTSGITVPEIKAKLRRQKNVGVAIIDYLQLMQNPNRRGGDNRVQEISEITRGLKLMAKDLNIPIITLSQLSRGPEGRQDHRPMLADLRESGSIEQDADVVMLLYREGAYNQLSDKQNICECNIAKNRHGETRMVELGWDGQYTRFSNLERSRDDG